jgi:hypothetical protein
MDFASDFPQENGRPIRSSKDAANADNRKNDDRSSHPAFLFGVFSVKELSGPVTVVRSERSRQ